MKLLVTGGYGFIGSNLIRLVLAERADWDVVNLDLVTYAANPANLSDVAADARYHFVQGDVADRALVAALYEAERFDAVIHAAAESHVDRSLTDPTPFLRTNVEGTLVLLEAARQFGVQRHVQVSTDEVYGTLAPEAAPFTESTPLAPRSPYSASKAAADQLALAFHHSHALDVVVTRCSNNYGPYQHPEKLIAYAITAALRGRRIPLYGDGLQVRDWVYVEDHCRALVAALELGRAGEVYNIGGAAERTNADVVRAIVDLLSADVALIEHVADRPGHDRRYAIDGTKAARELGWTPSGEFSERLAQTVRWYVEHVEWWESTVRAALSESRARIARWERGDRGV